MSATLTSRLPLITAEMALRVSAAVKLTAEAIAADAGAAAPVGPTGDLGQGIEARRVKSGEYGVYAEWYWIFPEFGTSHSAATPYMLPAAEAHVDLFAAEVTGILRGL